MRVPGITFVQGRNGRGAMNPCAIAIHATANTAPAVNEASYATRRTDGIGAHFYADATRVIQSLDTTVYAVHAGSSNGNRNAIAVEITGLNAWSRERWLQEVDWAELGAVLAYVCRAHGIPVQRRTVAEMKAGGGRTRGFYTHNDMRLAWGGTDHTDPGGNFPFDRLLAAVQNAVGGSTPNGDDMALTDAQRDALLERLDGRITTLLYNPLTNAWNIKGEPNQLRIQLDRIEAGNAALRTVVEQLAAVIQAGGGNVETAVILEAMDARLDELAKEQRDAVADLGINEAAVRAGADD